MASDTVELTIRCAMQNFEDRKVKCALEWTVLRLKQHLRDIYSTRPEVARQRLIHSGRVLENEQSLRSALRFNEENGGGSLVIHLVGATIKKPMDINPGEGIRHRTVPNSNPTPIDASHDSNSPSFQYHAAVHTRPTYPFLMMTGIPIMGAPHPSASFAYNGQNAYEAYAASYQNYVNQTFYQQQMFLQQQQQQYAGTHPNPLHFMPHGQAGQAAFYANLPILQQHQAILQQNNMFPMAAPQLQEVNPQEAINVAAANAGAIDGAAGDGEGRQPDVLDLVYKAIRFSLLMMLLYVYSSLERFFFVLVVIAAVKFIQMRRRHNAAAARQRPAPQPAAQAGAANNETSPPASSPASPSPPPTLSAWNVFWSTVVAFFASLIPDAPMPVN